MKFNASPRSIPSLISIATFTVLLIEPNASAVVTPPLTKCHIEVENPHISRFLFRTRGIRAVKVNARSQCNQPMSNLRLTVEIYKVGLFRDHLAGKEFVFINGLIPENKIIRNEKTYVKCLDMRSSKYYGTAFATAVISGKTVRTMRVLSEKTLSFSCGF